MISPKFHRKSCQYDRFVRSALQNSHKKLAKTSCRARLPPNFTEKASKRIVSCEASSKFQRRSWQKHHLLWSGVGGQLLSHHLLWSGVGGQPLSYHVTVVRGWWSAIVSSFAVVRAHLSNQKPFTPATCYTRHPLHQTPVTPDTLYTGHLLHQAPFTPENFYTRHFLHQTPFTPDTFYTRRFLHQTPFTPDTFYTKHLLHQAPFTPEIFYTRHLLHQTPLTPSTFYTKKNLHQTLFTPDTFYTRHLLHQTPFTPNTFYTRKNSQKDRFARCFQQFSQRKLPKRSFRARLLRNFTAQACKTSVSRDAFDNFHRKSFQNDRFVRGFLEISQNKLPKRSFCARLPRNFTEQASRKVVSCEASSKFHRTILLKRTFRTRLPTISTENLHLATVSCNRPAESYERVHPATTACHPKFQNVRFTTAACAKMYESSAQRPRQPAAYKNHHFTTVSDV